MIRLNITIPEDIVEELNRIENKSRFIADTLREKFSRERKKNMEKILESAYKKAAQEDAPLVKDFDDATADGVD